MQFRRAGDRVQVLAYGKYSAEKKRGTIRFLGSFHAYSFSLSDELKSNATDEEMKEVMAKIDSMRHDQLKNSRLYAFIELPQRIESAVAGLSESASACTLEKDVSADWAARVYEQLDALAKAMRKAGMRRPAKPAAAPVAPAGQLDLVHDQAPQALDSQVGVAGLDLGPQGGPTTTVDPQGGGQGWGYAGSGFNPA